jgi:hypothetical protein
MPLIASIEALITGKEDVKLTVIDVIAWVLAWIGNFYCWITDSEIEVEETKVGLKINRFYLAVRALFQVAARLGVVITNLIPP